MLISSWKWYDLGRGVAHLGQDVAHLSQVLSFLAEKAHTALLVGHPSTMLCLACQPPFQDEPNQSPPRVSAEG
ncbi:hypothetical protein CsSME_00038441 [Camellia sinensis var. sinensis]